MKFHAWPGIEPSSFWYARLIYSADYATESRCDFCDIDISTNSPLGNMNEWMDEI